jgi:hypothetical protein
MQKKFLFVFGCPRSGTTYFHSIMAWHPAIALGLERFSRRMLTRTLMPLHFDRQRFFCMEAGDTWYDNLLQFPGQQRLCEEHYDAAEYVGDKVPLGYEVFDHLITHFFDVRFVVLVRNVFDVAASYERRRRGITHWNREWGPRKAVEHWNASLRAILEYAEVAQVLPLLYEDLTVSATTLDGVAEFLAIDPKPSHLRWQTKLRREPRPEPGAGEQQIAAADAAFVRQRMDHDALARVTQLSRRMVREPT